MRRNFTALVKNHKLHVRTLYSNMCTKYLNSERYKCAVRNVRYVSDRKIKHGFSSGMSYCFIGPFSAARNTIDTPLFNLFYLISRDWKKVELEKRIQTSSQDNFYFILGIQNTF